MGKTFNLTPLRLRALRRVQQSPGLLASELADLCEKRAVSWQKKPVNGFNMTTSGSAAATRWGARYAQLMIEQGLMRADVFHDGPGWGRLFLTPLGQEVARTGVYEKEGSTDD